MGQADGKSGQYRRKYAKACRNGFGRTGNDGRPRDGAKGTNGPPDCHFSLDYSRICHNHPIVLHYILSSMIHEIIIHLFLLRSNDHDA